jgi:hypothetical protein
LEFSFPTPRFRRFLFFSAASPLSDWFVFAFGVIEGPSDPAAADFPFATSFFGGGGGIRGFFFFTLRGLGRFTSWRFRFFPITDSAVAGNECVRGFDVSVIVTVGSVDAEPSCEGGPGLICSLADSI